MMHEGFSPGGEERGARACGREPRPTTYKAQGAALLSFIKYIPSYVLVSECVLVLANSSPESGA